MNDRIKAIRKALNLSQDEFASALGYTRGKITNIESGKVTPNADDPFIALLCRTWNVNPDFIKHGHGSMFLPVSRKQAIADFMADCLKDEEDSFRVGLVEALASLSIEEWEVLAKIASTLAEKNTAKKKD